MALQEITANGQAYANENGSCLNSTEPVWESDSLQFRCIKDANNHNTGQQQILVRDINPNSPTYNQQQWLDAGMNSTDCPPYVCNENSNCKGINKKCVNGNCQVAFLDIISQNNNNNICTTVWGYRFSDGTIRVSHTDQTAGQCP